VSTEEQTLNFSLEYQEEHIRKFCNDHNYDLKHIYNEGFGSGTNVEERGVFCNMIADCLQNDDIDYVIVLADHRFARNHADAVNLVDRLIKSGTNLICVADRINTENRNDYDYFRNKSMYSERHRDAILFNCMYGMRQRAKNGLPNGGRITGYINTPDGYVINEETSPIVEVIFDKYVNEGWGYRKIAQFLNKKEYTTINNGEFDINAVKTILTNQTYIGYVKFENEWFVGKHEPIISLELWEKAQQFLQLRSYIPEKVHHGSYFLTGILKCPDCNASMVHHVSSCGKYRYYKCLNNKNGKNCKANSIKKDYAENYILDMLSSIINSPYIQSLLLQKTSRRISNELNEYKKTLRRLNKEITKTENRIQKTYELYYKTNNDSHLKQLERLNKQLDALVSKKDTTDYQYQTLKNSNAIQIVDSLTTNFRSDFLQLEDTDKSSLLKSLIEEIKVNNGQKMKERKIKEVIFHVTVEEIHNLISA